MNNKTLPIWRDANRLLLEMEQAVRHFPRSARRRVPKLRLGNAVLEAPASRFLTTLECNNA